MEGQAEKKKGEIFAGCASKKWLFIKKTPPWGGVVSSTNRTILTAGWHNAKYQQKLHGETLATAAGAGSIRITESKTLSTQTAGKLQRGIEQIKEALQIGDHLHAIVFKDLVGGPGLIVKIHFIGQAGATAGNDADPHEIVAPHLVGVTDFVDFLLGIICYENHGKRDWLLVIG